MTLAHYANDTLEMLLKKIREENTPNLNKNHISDLLGPNGTKVKTIDLDELYQTLAIDPATKIEQILFLHSYNYTFLELRNFFNKPEFTVENTAFKYRVFALHIISSGFASFLKGFDLTLKQLNDLSDDKLSVLNQTYEEKIIVDINYNVELIKYSIKKNELNVLFTKNILFIRGIDAAIDSYEQKTSLSQKEKEAISQLKEFRQQLMTVKQHCLAGSYRYSLPILDIQASNDAKLSLNNKRTMSENANLQAKKKIKLESGSKVLKTEITLPEMAQNFSSNQSNDTDEEPSWGQEVQQTESRVSNSLYGFHKSIKKIETVDDCDIESYLHIIHGNLF